MKVRVISQNLFCFLLLNLKTDDYIWQPFLYKSATLIDLNSHQASTNFIFVFCQSFHKTLLRYLVSEHSVFKTKIKRRSTNLCTTAQMCVLPVSFPVDLINWQSQIHRKGNWQNAPLCTVQMLKWAGLKESFFAANSVKTFVAFVNVENSRGRVF